MRIRWLALAVLATVIVGCGTETTQMDEETRAIVRTAESILAGLSWDVTDEPDVVLLAARAQAHLTALDGRSPQPLEDMLDHLLDLGRGGPDRLAWGLSWEFDAFGDGTPNPISANYSYTTAAAALALLDGYSVTHDDRLLERARTAVETIVATMCCDTFGDERIVWYSDQPADQAGQHVPNVSGLTLAAIERLGAHGVTSDALVEVRDGIVSHLHRLHGHVPSDTRFERIDANWPYIEGGDRPNDLLHHTFIVEGLLYGGGPERTMAAEALAGIAEHHFDDAGRPQEAVATMGSLGWGPGAGIFILAGQNAYSELVARAALRVRELTSDSGSVSYVETWARDVPWARERGNAWYALGLARHALVRIQREGELLPPEVTR